jgi:hypothetical protein
MASGIGAYALIESTRAADCRPLLRAVVSMSSVAADPSDRVALATNDIAVATGPDRSFRLRRLRDPSPPRPADENQP